MNKKIKIVLYNLMVLLALVMLIETISFFFNTPKEPQQVVKEDRGLLPNYKTHDWALTHFKEYNTLKSEYRSYYGWRRIAFNGETINIDSNGIRTTLQEPKLDKTNPVVFLGGSTIWGAGVNDINTIPSLYASKSKEEREVFNYGEIAYCAYQSLQFLELEVVKGLKPSIVISYDGVNNSPFRLPKPYSHKREQQIIDEMKGADRSMNNTIEFLPSSRMMLNNLSKKMNYYFSKVKRKFVKPAPQKIVEYKPAIFTKAQNEAAATELLETWLKMKKLCDEVDAEFYCVLQPTPYVGNPDTTNLSYAIRNYIVYGNAFNYYDNVRGLLNTEKYDALKPRFIDLTLSLDRAKNVYIDFCHLSPDGNSIVVDSLIINIKRKREIKPLEVEEVKK